VCFHRGKLVGTWLKNFPRLGAPLSETLTSSPSAVLGRDGPELVGVGFFHQALVVAVNHVRAVPRPKLAASLLCLCLGQIVSSGSTMAVERSVLWYQLGNLQTDPPSIHERSFVGL